MDESRHYWRLCSNCKKEIPFTGMYFACSVSTCNQKRSLMSFCSLPCFQAHVPVLRHRDAWAEERRAPTLEEWMRERQESNAEAEARASAPDPVDAAPLELNDAELPSDILVVASKLKNYIRVRSGMKTSDGVMTALSDILRHLCDQAIRNAAMADRKTVLDRDFAVDKLVLKK
jgi:histone H3/H4